MLHNANFVHGDPRAPNIVLVDKGREEFRTGAYIIDFDWAGKEAEPGPGLVFLCGAIVTSTPVRLWTGMYGVFVSRVTLFCSFPLFSSVYLFIQLYGLLSPERMITSG